MTLRNRIVMSPMENMYGSAAGLPTQRSIDYFVERARGGVALITLGASSVDAQHKEVPNGFHFGSDNVIAAHRDLAAAVHEHGARIQPQLVHAGPDGLAPEIHGIPSVGPSSIPSNLSGTVCRMLEEHELPAMIDLFRASAERIRAAGYDGLELHAAHAYMLLGSFLSPWRNSRRDCYSARKGYGGARFVGDVVRAIKSEAGQDFPLTLRISGDERIAGGRSIEHTQRIAELLAEAGVDAFHVSGGVIDRHVTQMVNGSHDRNGLNVTTAAALRNTVDVPIIVAGRIHSAHLAEEILAQGAADFIAMGRPLIADPQLPNKSAIETDRVRHCISCQNCIDSMQSRAAMDCAVNASAGRESDLRIVKSSARKKVMIIGAGPAGMEAARVAAARGHRVTLCERNHYLGGALVLASTVHPENQPFLDYLRREVERGDITIRSGDAITAEEVCNQRPDAAIVATGGRLVTPSIPGDDMAHVLSSNDLRHMLAGIAPPNDSPLPPWQRLGLATIRLAAVQRSLTPERLRIANRVWMPMGKRVAIIGADLAAIELAEHLATCGRSISVISEDLTIAPEVGDKRRSEHLRRLDEGQVTVNTGMAIDHIQEDGVVCRRSSGSQTLIAADSVLIAGHIEADLELFENIRNRIPQCEPVGDCTGLGLIRKAVLDGALAATRI